MPDEEWVKTLEDGRKVIIYQQLPTDGACITAHLGGREVGRLLRRNKNKKPAAA